jgi:hypothetical protein
LHIVNPQNLGHHQQLHQRCRRCRTTDSSGNTTNATANAIYSTNADTAKP